LLCLLEQKTLSQQWNCCEAIRKPEAWLLPAFSRDGQPPGKILETLSRMKTLPLKRDAFGELEKNYVLPEGLRSLFRSASTYAEGAAKLESWERRGLLLPRDPYSFMFENLGIDEYERTARVRCLGHAPAVLEKIAVLLADLSIFPKPRNDFQARAISSVQERLRRLKEQKITPEDTRFVQKATDLFTERKTIERFRWARYALTLGGSIGGGWLFNLARTLTKTPGKSFFWYCLVIGGGGLLWNILDKAFHLREMSGLGKENEGNEGNEKNEKKHPSGRGRVIVPLVVLAGYMASGAFPLLLPEYFLRFASWVLGAVPGAAIPCVGGGFFLAKNTKSILKACEEYSRST
jgi:hypothetical protein